MALLKCPKCGHIVSEYALSCVGCGCPINDVKKNLSQNNSLDLLNSQYLKTDNKFFSQNISNNNKYDKKVDKNTKDQEQSLKEFFLEYKKNIERNRQSNWFYDEGYYNEGDGEEDYEDFLSENYDGLIYEYEDDNPKEYEQILEEFLLEYKRNIERNRQSGWFYDEEYYDEYYNEYYYEEDYEDFLPEGYGIWPDDYKDEDEEADCMYYFSDDEIIL